MKVLIFEPDFEGHRLHTVGLILGGLAGLSGVAGPAGGDVRVTLATRAGLPGTPEFRVHLGPLSDRFDLDAWMPPARPGSLGSALERMRSLRRAVERVRPDHVYVPLADGLSQVMGVRSGLGGRAFPAGVTAEGLMLRGPFAYPQPSRTRRLKARLAWAAALMTPWSVLHHMDPIVYEKMRGMKNHGRAGQFRLLPDTAEAPAVTDRSAARRSLNIPAEGRYVGSAGVLDARKGIDLLVRAFAASPLAPDDRLLLVGRHAPQVKALLAGEFAGLVRSGRILSIDGYADVPRLEAALAAMDVVCTPYPRHYGSVSIAIRAAASRRFVLASDFGWNGWIVPRFRLGETVDVTDPAAFAAALPGALDRSAGFRLTAAGERFLAFHSPENARAAWSDFLRQRLGLGPAPGRRSWEWALGA